MRVFLGLLLIATLITPPEYASAESRGRPFTTILGVVASHREDRSGRATIFDTGTNEVLGSVIINPADAIGDCVITHDGALAFVTDFDSHLWVIDMATLAFAEGTNPIIISNFGEDMEITPDGRFIVVCDGGNATQPVSVVDIASRTEVSALLMPGGTNSLDVCGDGSVLVTSFQADMLARLTIDAAGNLTDTGERLSLVNPNNVYCAPGDQTGVVVTRNDNDIRSFSIPGLTLLDHRILSSGFGICGVISPNGDRLYFRGNVGGTGALLEAFTYDSGTGEISLAPLYTVAIEPSRTLHGIDQLAIHPDGSRLYLPQPSALTVYDAETGALVGAVVDESIDGGTGVCLATGPGSGGSGVSMDIKPGSCPSPLNIKVFQKHLAFTKPGVLPVAILGSAEFDVKDIDVSTITMEGVAALRASYEDVSSPVDGAEECKCAEQRPDGFVDLTLKFEKSRIAATLGDVEDEDLVPLTLDGRLLDGTLFSATDCIRINNREGSAAPFSEEEPPTLFDSQPNPFNPVTRIRYVLPRREFVTLSVYDVQGREVARLIDRIQPAGEHVQEWDARGFASGIYFYRLSAGRYHETRRMVLLK